MLRSPSDLGWSVCGQACPGVVSSYLSPVAYDPACTGYTYPSSGAHKEKCWRENARLSFTGEKLTRQGIGLVGEEKSYKGNSGRFLQLSNSTTKCFIHLPLLFGGRRTSPEAPAIIILVAFQWQYSQLPEALINKTKIHTAKLEHTNINTIFLFAGQVKSFCKELLCWLLSSQKRISCFSSVSEVISELWF